MERITIRNVYGRRRITMSISGELMDGKISKTNMFWARSRLAAGGPGSGTLMLWCPWQFLLWTARTLIRLWNSLKWWKNYLKEVQLRKQTLVVGRTKLNKLRIARRHVGKTEYTLNDHLIKDSSELTVRCSISITSASSSGAWIVIWLLLPSAAAWRPAEALDRWMEATVSATLS